MMGLILCVRRRVPAAVVLTLLGRIGLVTSQMLREKRRYSLSSPLSSQPC